MDDIGRTKDVVPVYLSLKTFQSAIQNFRDHGLPSKIDRTALGTRSGADQSQIMSALKFLSLIDDKDQTQEPLQKLHDCRQNSEEEKKVLAEILRASYRRVFELDLKTATPQMLEAAIGSYGASGSTKDRAVRFFIKAAEYCGIKLSGHLTHGIRSRGDSTSTTQNSGNGTAPKPKRKRRATQVDQGRESHDDITPASAVKTISLRQTGGKLTLNGTFNLFELDGEERKLVFDIIDLMKQYEQQKKTASE
ncbi:MAG: DUF5343 domain-containing protein [Rhabdochlamydiaceae bacterium]